MSVDSPEPESIWVDPDDAPELDEAWFEKANLVIGREVVTRGWSPATIRKLVSERLDSDGEQTKFFTKPRAQI